MPRSHEFSFSRPGTDGTGIYFVTLVTDETLTSLCLWQVFFIVFPEGGGTALYKLYKHVPPHRVGFLRRFGLKTGIHFAHFGLESGMVFEGTTGVYERIYRFNSK